MVGNWNLNVQVGKAPQQVATAFGNILGTLFGAKYTPIAYLGDQVVNGTNHAVLAEQLVITGEDQKNIVEVVLNEKPGSVGGSDFALAGIKKLIDGGHKFGGFQVNVEAPISDEAKKVFDDAFEGFVGSKIEPFALLGTQVVKGVEYAFAATVAPVVPNAQQSVQIIYVNGLTGDIEFEPVI